MTMTVNGPNGVVVRFPDGTDPATINKVMQEATAKSGFPAAVPAADQPWYGEEKGIAAKMLDAGKNLVTGIDDVMSGRVDPKSDQGIANITDAALVGTPVSAATRGGLNWMGAKPKPKTKAVAPTGVELKGIGGAGFDMARGMDVRYNPGAVQSMAMKLQSRLLKEGFRDRPESASETFAEIRGILGSGGPGAFVSIDDLHAIRRSLQNTAQNFNKPTDQKAAAQLIQEIDEFIINPDPKAVMAGDAAEAGRIWSEAKGNYAAGSKSDELRGLESNAEIDAAVANSGSNIENRIRARVGAILKSKKEQSGYTPQEIQMMDELAKGTTFRNWVRKVGNLGGGGGALAALMGGMGVHFGGPLGLGAAIAVPATAKFAGNQMARGALHRIDEAVRQRSPYHQGQVATAPVPPPLTTPGTRSMMGRTAVGVLPATRPAPPPTPMTKEQYEEYLRQKWALEQGA